VSNDLTEITKVLNLYIDGAGNGNADYLWSAFHESARWFGSLDGLDWDINKDEFTAMMVEQPGNPSSARIVDIRIAGTAAIATVEEEGFWETLSFTNFFTLAILEGRWQITCKTFARTDGSHA
jgi:hypothetical protein